MSTPDPDYGHPRDGLTIIEAAALLGVGRRTAAKIVQGIPHFRFGKRVRVPRAAIDEYLQRSLIVPERAAG